MQPCDCGGAELGDGLHQVAGVVDRDVVEADGRAGVALGEADEVLHAARVVEGVGLLRARVDLVRPRVEVVVEAARDRVGALARSSSSTSQTRCRALAEDDPVAVTGVVRQRLVGRRAGGAVALRAVAWLLVRRRPGLRGRLVLVGLLLLASRVLGSSSCAESRTRTALSPTPRGTTVPVRSRATVVPSSGDGRQHARARPAARSRTPRRTRPSTPMPPVARLGRRVPVLRRRRAAARRLRPGDGSSLGHRFARATRLAATSR